MYASASAVLTVLASPIIADSLEDHVTSTYTQTGTWLFKIQY